MPLNLNDTHFISCLFQCFITTKKQFDCRVAKHFKSDKRETEYNKHFNSIIMEFVDRFTFTFFFGK